MKKHLVLLVALVATLIMASCSKEEANYYVKYEASAYTPHASTIYISVNTENGVQSIQAPGNTFSETFGPVQKGFKASISASVSVGTTSTSIYVSRGEEPFVLKATGGETAEYVIDF